MTGAAVVLANGTCVHTALAVAGCGVQLDLERPDGSLLGRLHLTQDEVDDLVEALWGARRRLYEGAAA